MKYFVKITFIIFIFLFVNINFFAQDITGDSLALVALYDSTDGDNWTDNTNWNNGPVSTWYGVTVSGGRVKELNLFGNNLRGPIPPEIGNLDSLTWVSFGSNELTESVPPEIGNLKSLRSLNLDASGLTGSIPAEIGDLTRLEFLSLSFNQLTGSIPPEIGNLKSLNTLMLRYNELTGTIPPEIGNLDSLEFLELENNELTGSVPMEIGNLVELIVLLLSNNNLVDLPSLWALSSLQFLWIQDNKLTFEDIESNIGIPSHQYIYSPQDSVGEAKDTTINEGINITLYVSADGQHTQYQWMKNGDDISSATDNLYTINSADTSDAGSYTCRITNTVATELTLYSRPINITVKTSGVPSKLPEVYSMKVKRITADKNLELRYTLPEMTNIRLSVYDITGKVIKGFSEEQQAGFYSRKIDMHGKHTGVYFIRMEAEGKKFTKTTKVVFIK